MCVHVDFELAIGISMDPIFIAPGVPCGARATAIVHRHV